MKLVLIYQVQRSDTEWDKPLAYVPENYKDYIRCKSYTENDGVHFIKEIKVNDDVNEINLKQYLTNKDNVYSLDKWFYLVGKGE